MCIYTFSDKFYLHFLSTLYLSNQFSTKSSEKHYYSFYFLWYPCTILDCIGEINNLRQVTDWTMLSFMCALPHLCFVIYCLSCFRIVTAWLLGQLMKSSLMLHGVMTVVLTVPPHLIHRKVAQLAVLAKTVWPADTVPQLAMIVFCTNYLLTRFTVLPNFADTAMDAKV